MRLAVLCAVLCLVPAFASAHGCIRPGKPAFPDPNTGTSEQVQRLAHDMQAYSTGMNAYIICLNKESDEAQTEGVATINNYNQQFLPIYNKRATE